MTVGGGDDFLSARINFELPQEAMSQMREFNTELERVRVNTESAARGVDSFVRYIDLMNTAQERTIQSSRNLAANMERLLSIQERAGGASAGTAVPQGYSTPWAAGVEGMGRGRDIAPLPTTIPTGGSQTAFDRLLASDPRAYLGARAAYGGGQPGELPPVSVPAHELDQLSRRIADRDYQQHQQSAKTPEPATSPDAQDAGGGPTPRGRRQQQQESQPWESWRDRASRWAGGASAVASGMGAGGSTGGLLSMAAKAMQGYGRRGAAAADGVGGSAPRIIPGASGGTPASVPHMGQVEESLPGGPGVPGQTQPGGEDGGGLSISSGLGVGGASLTAGLAVFGAIQKIGQEVQGYRNLGAISGGGFKEGFGYEMQARMMAMNPLLTTQQARQIVQTAATQGWSGKEYENVIDFMTHNLTEMNVSIAESAKLLHESAHNSNMSIGSMTENLRHNFSTMKELSKTGYNKYPERQQAYEQVYGNALQAGIDPVQAGKLGNIAGQVFSDRPGWSDMGARLSEGAISSPTFGYMMMQFGGPGGTRMGDVPGADYSDPGSIPEALGDSGQLNDAQWNTLSRIAQMAPNAGIFQRMVAKWMGVQLTRSEAKTLWQRAKAVGTGTDEDPLKAARDVEDQDRKQDRKRMIEQGRMDLQMQLGPHAQITDEAALANARKHGYTGTSQSTRIENQVLEAFNGQEIEIGSGNTWGPWDPSKLEDLKSGKLRVRARGSRGEGTKVSEIPGYDPTGTGPGSGMGREVGGGGKNKVSGQLQITVHPANMRSALNVPSHIPLTANEIAANSGYGNATKNDPPPGDGIVSRGFR